jgi:ParB family chromosome partitioning protein
MAKLGKLKLKDVRSRIGTQDIGSVAVTIKDIPVGDIQIKENVRTEYTGIEELAESIKQYGLLQPIAVYQQDDEYIVKTGHRRFKAYQKLAQENPDRFHSIRCIVSNGNDVAVIQLIENVQRENLSSKDLCDALFKFREKGMTNGQIAEMLGKSEGYIRKMFVGINEIQANDELQDLVCYAGVTIDDVIETRSIPDKEMRFDLLKQRGNGEVTKDGMRKTVRQAKAPKPEPAKLIIKKVKVELEVVKHEGKIVLRLPDLEVSNAELEVLVEDVNSYLTGSDKYECIPKPV